MLVLVYLIVYIAKDLIVSTIFRIVMLLKLNSQVAQSPGRMLYDGW